MAAEMRQEATGVRQDAFWQKPLVEWTDGNVNGLVKKRLVSMVISARTIRALCLATPPQPQPAAMARQSVQPAVMLAALEHDLLAPLQDDTVLGKRHGSHPDAPADSATQQAAPGDSELPAPQGNANLTDDSVAPTPTTAHGKRRSARA